MEGLRALQTFSGGIGVLSGIGWLVFANQNVSSYQACADGWGSPSIGRAGACSHHGGVVTHTVDHRSEAQKGFSTASTATCAASFATFLLASRLLAPNRPIEIQGATALVPLTIAGETREVEVVRITPALYRTKNAVAKFRCPAGKRKTVFALTVDFVEDRGKFRPVLTSWISTHRGRAGGYTAAAFAWT